MPFLSKTEREILAAWRGQDVQHKIIADRTGKSITSINSHLTRIFQKYREAIKVMNKHPQIFKGRFKRHNSETWEEIRILRKNIKEAE